MFGLGDEKVRMWNGENGERQVNIRVHTEGFAGETHELKTR